jgi:hypothetical protein
MSDEQPQSVPVEEEVPADAPDVDELELIDEDDDILEQDASEEATVEAGMTDEGVELAPTDEVKFEEDDSGVAR